MTEVRDGGGDDSTRTLERGAQAFGALLLLWFAFAWWRVIDADHWQFQRLQASGQRTAGWVVDRGKHQGDRGHYFTLAARIDGQVHARRWEHNLPEELARGCLLEHTGAGFGSRRIHPSPSTTPQQRVVEANRRCSSEPEGYDPWPIEVLYSPESPASFMPTDGPLHVSAYLLAAAIPTVFVLLGVWALYDATKDAQD